MPSIASIDDKLFDRYRKIADSISKGETPELDSEITRLYASIFKDSIKEGYGSGFSDQKPGTDLFERLAKMEADAQYFAAAKQARYIEDLKTAHATLSKEEFEYFRDSYHLIQNRTWLQAEKDMMLANAQMAERWHQMQEIETLPNLKYVTVGDDNVRPAHQALDGINLPMSDPFWLTHYPPLGFGCRCDVQQNDDEVSSDKAVKKQTKSIAADKAFGFNPGITNKIVGDDHPYLSEFFKSQKQSVLLKEHCTLAEELITFEKKGAKTIQISCFVSIKELLYNLEVAKKLLADKNNVIIRAYHEFGHSGPKQPDLIVNGKLADIKTPITKDTLKGLGRAVSDAHKQGNKIAIVDLRKHRAVDIAKIKSTIAGKTKGMNKNIEEVWVLLKGGKIIKQKRHS